MKTMWVRTVVLSAPLLMVACAAEREITRPVVEEPRYCYRQLDGVRCFSTPLHRDERRLVGFTGPHPERFPKPKEPAAKLYPPDPIAYWVKDAELIPEPAPVPPGRRVAPPPVRADDSGAGAPMRHSSPAVTREPLFTDAENRPGAAAP